MGWCQTTYSSDSVTSFVTCERALDDKNSLSSPMGITVAKPNANSENVFLKDPFYQRVNTLNFSGEEIAKRKRSINELGEFVDVTLRVHSEGQNYLSPSTLEQSQNRNRQVSLSANPNSNSNDELLRLVTNFVYDTLGSRFSDVSLNAFIGAKIKNPLEVKKAIEHNSKRQSSENKTRNIQLTNVGLNRYFWFRPENESKLFPARVLDIHLFKSNVSLVIEWLKPEPMNYKRIRFVSELSKEAASTIVYEIENYTRIDAFNIFKDSLSVNEILAQKLAQAIKLRTFGYTDYSRYNSYVEEDSLFSSDLLSAMTDPIQILIYSFVKNAFPQYKKYLNEEELAYEKKLNYYINIADVFSRMPLDTFFSEFVNNDPNIVYFWVITEDGALKISPFSSIENESSIPIFSARLAHGRRVYAAGKMIVDAIGSIHIDLDSENYQIIDDNWLSSKYSFDTKDNGALKTFIAYVFKSQAKRIVETINHNPASRYYHYNNYWAESQGASFGDRGPDFSNDYEFYEFLNSMYGSRSNNSQNGQPSNGSNSVFSEVNGKPMPLNKSEWQEKMGINYLTPDDELFWAHSVLGTTSDLSFIQIKQTYRSLASKYHPDKLGPNPPEQLHTYSEAYFKVVQEAFETLQSTAN